MCALIFHRCRPIKILNCFLDAYCFTSTQALTVYYRPGILQNGIIAKLLKSKNVANVDLGSFTRCIVLKLKNSSIRNNFRVLAPREN